MKRYLKYVAIPLLIFPLAVFAVDTLMDSYSETNVDNSLVGYIRGGQSFTTPNDGNSYYITSVKFYVKKTGTQTGSSYAELYAHSGTYGTNSLPTGSPLATSNGVVNDTIGTTYSLVTWNFSTSYLMSPNTHYVIVFYDPNGNANAVDYGFDISSPSASGNMVYKVDGTSPLNTSSLYDLSFYVYGSLTNPAATAKPVSILSLVRAFFW